jgi:ketopantoate hydroxymethyltransferase
MDSVKLEGGQEMCPAIMAILDAGIPILGHIGLTPQLQSKIIDAFVVYREEVNVRSFPAAEHIFGMKAEEEDAF